MDYYSLSLSQLFSLLQYLTNTVIIHPPITSQLSLPSSHHHITSQQWLLSPPSEKHIDGLENGNSHPEPVKKKKTLKLPKKKKKKEKKDKGATGDADKDVDETETPADPKKKKKKKKWLF